MPINIGLVGGAGNLKNPSEPLALGYRVNWIKNPSFEVDTTGWAASPGATIAQTTSDSNTGTGALLFTNASGSFAVVTDRIPMLSNGPFQVSMYIKLLPGADTANYLIRHLQYETEFSTSTVSSGNVGIQNLSVTGEWVRLSGQISKAAIANYVIIRLVTQSAQLGDQVLIDSVMFEDAATLGTYFDGDVDGFWSGTPNNSYSGGSPY
jgi:hypothetical protein